MNEGGSTTVRPAKCTFTDVSREVCTCTCLLNVNVRFAVPAGAPVASALVAAAQAWARQLSTGFVVVNGAPSPGQSLLGGVCKPPTGAGMCGFRSVRSVGGVG